MSAAFFGGMPTGPDVRKLVDEIGIPRIGVTITHDEISSALGCDPESTRYRTVVNAWRKQMLQQHNIELAAVPREGFKALDEAERVAGGFRGTRSGLRKVSRSIVKATMANTTDPLLLRQQDVLRRFGAAMSFEASRMAKEVTGPKPIDSLPKVKPPA